MKELDLTTAPPRPPRAEVLGIVFLPRSIDKLRASLPGGSRGVYNLAGFTEIMLEELGTTSERVLPLVASAKDDEEIAAALLRDAPAGAVEKWNAFVLARLPRGGNRAEALEAYPWLHERPDLLLAVDILAEDDRRCFASTG